MAAVQPEPWLRALITNNISRQPSPIHVMINQKQLDTVEYFNCVDSMLTNDARCTREMKSSIDMAKAVFKKKALFTSKLDLKFKEETSKVLHVECKFVWCRNLDTSGYRSEAP
jgi:hypothetical protein